MFSKIDLLTEIGLEVVAIDREFYNGSNRSSYVLLYKVLIFPAKPCSPKSIDN